MSLLTAFFLGAVAAAVGFAVAAYRFPSKVIALVDKITDLKMP